MKKLVCLLIALLLIICTFTVHAGGVLPTNNCYYCGGSFSYIGDDVVLKKDSTHHWEESTAYGICSVCGKKTEGLTLESDPERHDSDSPYFSSDRCNVGIHYYYKRCDTCNYEYLYRSISCPGAPNHAIVFSLRP